MNLTSADGFCGKPIYCRCAKSSHKPFTTPPPELSILGLLVRFSLLRPPYYTELQTLQQLKWRDTAEEEACALPHFIYLLVFQSTLLFWCAISSAPRTFELLAVGWMWPLRVEFSFLKCYLVWIPSIFMSHCFILALHNISGKSILLFIVIKFIKCKW